MAWDKSKLEYLGTAFSMKYDLLSYGSEEPLIELIKDRQQWNALLEEDDIQVVTTYCEGGYRRKNYKFKI